MAQPIPLQDRFDLGFKRDLARNQLPRGSAYDYVNVLPDMGAPLRKRGGWTAYGSALTTINVSAGYPRHVLYAPFKAGAQVIAIDDVLYRLFDLTNSADRSTAQVHQQAPVFFNELVIIGSTFATSLPPMKYDGSAAVGFLGGTPPNLASLAVHKSRLAGSGTIANSTGRIYFSGAGNPESWDTTNARFDTSGPIYAMASLPGGLLIFHAGSVEVLRGDTPPSATGIGDMSLSTLFADVGIHSPNAFSVDGDKVVWADRYGIYTSDGSAFTDLTKEGQIKDYWRAQCTTAGSGSYVSVGGWNGWVFVSLVTSSGQYVDFLACDVRTRTFYRFDGIRAKNFSVSTDTAAVYFSNQSTKQAGDMASVMSPSASNTSDPDGWPIIPIVDTAYYDLGTKGKKRARNVYAGYQLTGLNQTLQVAYAETPEDVTYTNATGTLATTSTYVRKRVRLGKAVNGFSLRLSTGFCDDFKLYSLETEAHTQEGSRL